MVKFLKRLDFSSFNNGTLNLQGEWTQNLGILPSLQVSGGYAQPVLAGGGLGINLNTPFLTDIDFTAQDFDLILEVAFNSVSDSHSFTNLSAILGDATAGYFQFNLGFDNDSVFPSVVDSAGGDIWSSDQAYITDVGGFGVPPDIYTFSVVGGVVKFSFGGWLASADGNTPWTRYSIKTPAAKNANLTTLFSASSGINWTTPSDIGFALAMSSTLASILKVKSVTYASGSASGQISGSDVILTMSHQAASYFTITRDGVPLAGLNTSPYTDSGAGGATHTYGITAFSAGGTNVGIATVSVPHLALRSRTRNRSRLSVSPTQ